MTRETAKTLLPVITAFANGEEIEVLGSLHNDWKPFDDLSFNTSPDRYRIKPKPREFWIVRCNDGTYETSHVDPLPSSLKGWTEVIHVREVLP